MESRKVKPMSESYDLRCKKISNKEIIQNRLSVRCSDLQVINRPKRSTDMDARKASVASQAPINPSSSDDTQGIKVPKRAKIMRVGGKAPSRTSQGPVNTSQSDDSRMAAPRRSRIMRVGGRAPSRASQVSVSHNGQMEVSKGSRVMRMGGKAPSRAIQAPVATSRNDSRIEVPEVSRIMRAGGFASSKASTISINSSVSDNSRTKVPKGSKIMRAGGKAPSRVSQVSTSTSRVDSRREVHNQSQDDIKCAICYDTENSQDFQPVLCGHSFHKACFETWIKNKSYCPMCRTPIDFLSSECMYKFRHFIHYMGRWAVRAFAR